jgi:fatty acid kinase
MTSATHSPAPRDAATCTGGDIQDLLDALACWLEAHAEHLNALNVFPVPDGDTGINMSRTLRAAADAATVAKGAPAAVFFSASRGALLGAAGNSGVILSQMMRGFAESFSERPTSSGDKLQAAFQAASDCGYKSVAQPVEGTILSVARAAAAGIARGSSLSEALSQALQSAARAVDATPTQLEKLRVAGVVDAGGEGLRLILEGAHRWMDGEDLRSIAAPPVVSRALVGSQHAGSEVGFCTQFIVERSSLGPDDLRAQIERFSTSVVVVGADELIRVHAHAQLPGKVLDIAVKAGTVSRVSIENMELQNESARDEADSGGTGIVAVAQSETAARLLQSLGATQIVIPAAASPTVQELLNGVQRIGHEHVLILPNDKNSVLAAQQLDGLTSRSIRILPTDNVVQCMQCLLAFNPDQDLESQMSHLASALGTATIIELARANRVADLPNAQVRVGNVVAISDGEIVAAGASAAEALAGAFGRANVGQAELATLYPCAEIEPAELLELEEVLRVLLPSVERETVPLDLPARLALVAME